MDRFKIYEGSFNSINSENSFLPLPRAKRERQRKMGRKPCCQKEGLNKGAWTAMEDKILTDYISLNGEGKWRDLPIYAGLKRCGKSCRLRWLNYLKPDIKRGNITPDEEDLIIRLHKLLGNRWSLIAGRLPGRTDNEIKNYWNTKLGKRVQGDGTINRLQFHDHQNKHRPSPSSSYRHDHHLQPVRPTCVVYTRATRCTKVVISKELENIQVKKDVGDTAKNPIETTLNSIGTNEASTSLLSPQGVLEQGPMPALDEFQSLDLKIDMDINDHVLSFLDLEYHHPQQTGREVMMSSPLANDYLFMNEVIHGELDADWITSCLQSELSKQSY